MERIILGFLALPPSFQEMRLTVKVPSLLKQLDTLTWSFIDATIADNAIIMEKTVNPLTFSVAESEQRQQTLTFQEIR